MRLTQPIILAVPTISNYSALKPTKQSNQNQNPLFSLTISPPFLSLNSDSIEPLTYSLDYAKTTSNNLQIKISKIIQLFAELLVAISSVENPKYIMSITINSFINLSSVHIHQT